MAAERLAGPSVQTILARRPAGKGGLLGCDELIDDAVKKVDARAEAGQRKALIVAVHPLLIGLGQGEGQQAEGLDVAQAQLGGVGGSGGKERYDDGSGELLGRDPFDDLKELGIG
jgi:hypothetical protein